ncbi:ubiquitin-like-conjugating enzyme ATG10 [Centroberyx affinis]|uniref:ubiquitin-like-conjugating enzyme ATG10 n=1 Tax=Centroberyx affinis TaxID=166261 RepID=UPI003A5C5B94
MSSSLLDEESFRRCCQLLLQQSTRLGDGWSWEPVQGSEEGYLRKTALRSVVVDSSPNRDQEGSGPASENQSGSHTGRDRLEQEKEQSRLSAPAASGDADDGFESIEDDGGDEDDGVFAVSEGSSRALQYEYHILYSCSYRTPVLYFRAFTLEGRSLSLDEVWSAVHPNYRLRLQQSPWNTITQQEHPLLGQSFFVLHPCRTEEFMKPVMQAAQQELRPVNYVVTWLSVVGPLVGLEIPLSYSTQSHPASHSDTTRTQPD